MKTTLEIPDPLFRRAKSAAAEQGISLRELVSQALAEKLRAPRQNDKPWLKTFGKLRRLRKESANIRSVIEQEFGKVELQDSPAWVLSTMATRFAHELTDMHAQRLRRRLRSSR